jgi:hypothetical protein
MQGTVLTTKVNDAFTQIASLWDDLYITKKGLKHPLNVKSLSCGERGIRTLGTVSSTTV